ncbi:acyl-ACP--UDP-N-acetylglucosamine O-acyltransferase [Verticiella sediminum]|uniref:Acyl-[acyl-carrier-protein]--UDP-N-acetylglucosamine O-acyltransferase n=1 Tax=Verticiella sediminum TaxID=1247510 RepID=A0A556ABR3_9BURK|nr:acyl-ACP--UDP-N-acetylglucosamine O-acyltransferase [Verticiella sediminum]TSH90332.1 acyl-ACP--UDP-N-acetylglucosamine O-acyltransferase [Verticiella sediminum]
MAHIHPSAVVDPGAELDSDVRVGPFTVIGPHVRIAGGTEIGPNCVIDGHTSIGRNNRFLAFCSIGAIPQDKKYRGEPTRLEVGDNNLVREFVTMHIGTTQDEGVTRVGNDNWIMTYVHIAHDCQIGNHTVLSSSAQLAGHVSVGDWAVLGGFTGVHQFVKIGAHCMTGGQSLLLQDVPPFVTAAGSPARAAGINAEGLKRRGFSPEAVRAIRDAYKVLYRQGLALAQAKDELRTRVQAGGDGAAALGQMLDFLDTAARGIVR